MVGLLLVNIQVGTTTRSDHLSSYHNYSRLFPLPSATGRMAMAMVHRLSCSTLETIKPSTDKIATYNRYIFRSAVHRKFVCTIGVLVALGIVLAGEIGHDNHNHDNHRSQNHDHEVMSDEPSTTLQSTTHYPIHCSIQ